MANRKKTAAKAQSKTAPAQSGRGRNSSAANSRRTASNNRSAGSGSSPGNRKRSSYWLVLFWLSFIILLLGLYLINRDAISNSIQTIQNVFAARNAPQGNNPAPEPSVDQQAAPFESSPESGTDSAAAGSSTRSPGKPEVSQQPSPVAASPSAAKPVPTIPQAEPKTTEQKPVEQKTTEQKAAEPAKTAQTVQGTQNVQAGQSPEAMPTTNELRERALYFIYVDRGGSILREKVSRKLPVSDSPLSDALQAIIAGPNGDEKQKGLMSLIPPNTKILSATVRGDTAYINFSEDFQYNTYGVEGYAAQLRQVVFTATEFPNVKNVQILIEGRRVDYLGEGIWIGSPLNPDMM